MSVDRICPNLYAQVSFRISLLQSVAVCCSVDAYVSYAGTFTGLFYRSLVIGPFLCISIRAPTSNVSAKEPNMPAKEPYVSAKEPFTSTNEIHRALVRMCEKWKELYISAKEPCTSTNKTYTTLFLFNRRDRESDISICIWVSFYVYTTLSHFVCIGLWHRSLS